MSKVLLVWEMGGGFGHISRLEMIASELLIAGFQVVLAVKDLTLALQWCGQTKFKIVALPDSNSSYKERFSQINYSAILASVGYRNLTVLQEKIEAWLGFYKNISPDFVVADHAPTAILAADIFGIKAIQFGGGFELPPSTYPLPNIQAWQAVSRAELEIVDADVLKVINKISASYGAKKYGGVGEIFLGRSILTTFPELDHYARESLQGCVGPIFSERRGLAKDWPAAKGKRVFAYIHASTPGYHAVITSLSRSGHSVVCVSPGVSRRYVEYVSSGTLSISAQMVDIERLLPDMQMAVVTGGLGIVSRLLLKGIPLLIAPQNVEQQMLGERVVSLGAAVMLGGARSVESVGGVLSELSGAEAYKARAMNFSRKYPNYSPRLAVSKVMGRVYK